MSDSNLIQIQAMYIDAAPEFSICGRKNDFGLIDIVGNKIEGFWT